MPADLPQKAPVTRPRSSLVVYFAMLVVSVAAFGWIRWQGQGLEAVGAGPGSRAVKYAASSEVLFHVLLALAVVIVAGRLLGSLCKRFGQPAVVGEVVAGILLGPSLLGWVAPQVSAFLLPPTVSPYLTVIAQVGIILFMFLVGLRLDTSAVRKRIHAVVAISHASIVAPFILGSLFSLWLYPRVSSPQVPFTTFALFMGVAMSVTAFPVLARILAERQMSQTRIGAIALACAAVDDVTAWCLLALVVGIAQSNPSSAAITVGLTLAYLAFMVWVVRPAGLWLARWHERPGRRGQDSLALLCVALLLSGLATEAIGIHALFGAFLLGAVIPHDSALAKSVIEKLEDIVVVLFLPAFFALTGMRTEIGLLTGLEQWLACGLIVVVATAGKFGGTLAAARLTGLGWRDAASLGALMNTRGLMGLIVLHVGLDLGVLSPLLFAMMVLMALVTTLMTTPLMQWLAVPSDALSKSMLPQA